MEKKFLLKIESRKIIGGLRSCIDLFLKEFNEEKITDEILKKYNFLEEDLFDIYQTKSKIRDIKIKKILN